MASGLPATVVITTEVLLEISAVWVMASFPSASSISKSSTNAPRVPEPSSRVTTEMGALEAVLLPSAAELLLLLLQPDRAPTAIAAHIKIAANFFILCYFLSAVVVSLNNCYFKAAALHPKPELC